MQQNTEKHDELNFKICARFDEVGAPCDFTLSHSCGMFLGAAHGWFRKSFTAGGENLLWVLKVYPTCALAALASV